MLYIKYNRWPCFTVTVAASLFLCLPLAAQAQFPGYSSQIQRYQRMPNGVPYNGFTGKTQTTLSRVNPYTGGQQVYHAPAAVNPGFVQYPQAGQYQVQQLPGYQQGYYPPNLGNYPLGQSPYRPDRVRPGIPPQPYTSYRPVGPVYGDQSYNPLTGEQVATTVTRNPYTGEVQTSAKVVNPLTGEESTYLKSYNPLTGQVNGSSTTYNPLTGQYQQSYGGVNPYTGRPYGSTAGYQINPYTGQPMAIPGATQNWR
ncbi:MAG: hypothetical protein SFX18_02060 [Pirellulales bacterium]|nr:hypothetical protein [Pirellulales bacterium]